MLEELKARIEQIRKDAVQGIASIKNLNDFQNYKAKIIGRSGSLTEILKSLATLPSEERPSAGKLINQIKAEIELKLKEKQKDLEEQSRVEKFESKTLDRTLPGLDLGRGSRHPISLVMQEIEEIFLRLGFSIYEGPEAESHYYNFEALNFPPDHPAICMQDTFYIKFQVPNSKFQTNSKFQADTQSKADARSQLLLRTHTSPVQIRVMEKKKPPLYMIAPGAVYRHDDDVTHSPMFHQVEGLMVDTHITFSDLKGILTLFCQTIFGKERKVRFRPSFFPFVEPGAEVDISCGLCKMKGCRVCSGRGWLEILGAGMVHPNVFKHVKVDPNRYCGFAFGMGVERIAMLKFGIHDIRLFFEGDLRFLEQF